MKYKVIIDESLEEDIVIYAKEESSLTNEIRHLIQTYSNEIILYNLEEIIKTNISEVIAFTVLENKVYAITPFGKFVIKSRLYQLNEVVGDSFIKINQSCLVNVKKIKRFKVSPFGGMYVVMEDGFTDFISRRQLKTVKERMGLWWKNI